jgi:Uma2 family endonuclease
MSIEVVNHAEHVEAMPLLNHSYICLQILRQLVLDETIEPLPELTLDIANGITPDISIFPKGQVYPNLLHDVLKYQEKPVLAIEVVSSSQTIQEMLEKAAQLIKAGVKTVWTVEPYSRSVFVTTPTEEQLFHGEKVESEGIKIDFSKVFSSKM